MENEKQAVCGFLDLPDQTSWTLAPYAYAAVVAEVIMAGAYTIYGLAEIDWEDEKYLDEFLLASTNAGLDRVFALLAGIVVLAALVSMYGLGTRDRGFLMFAAVLHVVVFSGFSIGLPSLKVALFGLFGVQPLALAAAWLVYRISEKIQEEGESEIDAVIAAAHNQGFNLPDLTTGRFRVLIGVSGVITFGLGLALMFLNISLGPEWLVEDYWELGAIVAIGSLASVTGAYFSHRTSLVVCNALSLVALACMAFSIPVPFLLEESQDNTCKAIPAALTAAVSNCDDELTLTRVYMALFFVTMVFLTGLTWLVWRFSEALQSSSVEHEEGLDTNLADEFTCLGCTVSRPVAFYRRVVYGVSVVFLALAVGAIVLAVISDEQGLERGLRKRMLTLGGVLLVTAVVAIAGAQARDRGLLSFAFFSQVLFVANALLILAFNVAIAESKALGDSFTKSFTKHGNVLTYGSFLNVVYFVNNPLSSGQEDRANIAVAIAAATILLSLVTLPFTILLSEAIQDEDDLASDDDRVDDEDEYTYATAYSGGDDQYSGYGAGGGYSAGYSGNNSATSGTASTSASSSSS